MVSSELTHQNLKCILSEFSRHPVFCLDGFKVNIMLQLNLIQCNAFLNGISYLIFKNNFKQHIVPSYLCTRVSPLENHILTGLLKKTLTVAGSNPTYLAFITKFSPFFFCCKKQQLYSQVCKTKLPMSCEQRNARFKHSKMNTQATAVRNRPCCN